ncbi:carbohydrate ABC transporter permease [Zafaria sp. J156]|uniref:carbohydrate ABC transporter permease n=1 Tax=Zafaria sp. J156 TaxID=3116490 RepID=UPI002E796E59|nr:sugar ABC transporter permease [Zafaria sp. J156]MEE1621894.1 sugar ABC transporter permease [Zafaria sp. J156]
MASSLAERRAGRLFVSPTVLTLLVLGAFPLLFILAAAFTDSSLGKPFKEFTGADNLATVLGNADVVASLSRTVGYAVGTTAASVVLGVVVATAVHQAVRSGAVVRTLLLLPLIVPPVVVGTLFKLIFNPAGGLLATVLGFVGIPAPAPLSDPGLALGAVMVADIWEWTPLVFILVFAALLGQDPSITEAARMDGAHGWKLFAAVTLPAIAGTIAAAAFIRLVLALKVFDLVYIMTAGGPGQSTTTTSYLIHQVALKEFDIGRASAITLLLAVVVTLVTLPAAGLAARLRRKEEATA